MTREQKKIVNKIHEIEEILDSEEIVGGGFASDELYEPVEGKILALKEQIKYLSHYKDMLERAQSSRIRGWVQRILLFLYDMFVINIAYLVAVIVRFSDSDSYNYQGKFYMEMFKEFAPWYTVICILLFILFRIYNGVWRYAGSNDVKKLMILNLSTCVIYIIGTLFVVGRMPITVYMAGACIQFVLMCVPRLAPRFIIDSFMRSRGEGQDSLEKPVMIVGISDNARIIQNKIDKDITNRFHPVCVIDYTYSCEGRIFNGLPVYSGPYAVYECIKKYGIRCVIIADADIPRDLLNSIRKICDKKKIELREFVIGTDNSIKGLAAGDLLKTTEGTVRIIGEDTGEKQYIDGNAALKDMSDDYVVDKVVAFDGILTIYIRNNKQEKSVQNYDDRLERYLNVL